MRLFDRTQRSVSMTDSGAAILEEARPCCARRTSPEAARNARERATMRLRVGHVPDSLPAGGVARAIQLSAASAPRMQISLETGSPRG